MSDRLAGVHPQLRLRIERILAAMAALGHPMMVTDGVQIVTNADGTTSRSNHQLHADGCGHAVDCTFVDAQGQPRWIDRDPWALYGLMGETLGLTWGGRIQTATLHGDRPHLEWTAP